jgi:hypothetical protein
MNVGLRLINICTPPHLAFEFSKVRGLVLHTGFGTALASFRSSSAQQLGCHTGVDFTTVRCASASR